MTPLSPFTTDVHCHLLPAVDEGSRSLSESLAMARALEALGVRTVHATPHQFRFATDPAPATVRARTDDVARHLRAAGCALDVRPGAEYLVSERLLDALDAGEELLTWSHLTAGGAATCVLVELPLRAPVVNVDRVAALFLRRGLQPVMAHPERVAALATDPGRARAWRGAGWRFQLDLLSLAGTYGRTADELARAYLDDGLYDHVGSDLHRSTQLDDLVDAHRALRAWSAPETPAS